MADNDGNTLNNMSTKKVAGISAAVTIGILVGSSLLRRAYNALTTTKVVTDTATHKESGTGQAAS